MQGQVKLKCKPNLVEIFSYFMYHSFSGSAGAIRIGISILFLGLAYATAGEVQAILTVLLVGVGLLNPAATPLFLYFRAKKAERQEKEIEYELSAEEVTVTQNGTRRRLSWPSFPLVVWGRKVLALYVDGSHALLLPRRTMGSSEAEILEMIRNLPASCRVRLGKKR